MGYTFILMGNVDDNANQKVCIFDIIPDDSGTAYNFRNMAELYKASSAPRSSIRVSMSEYLKTHPYPFCLREKLWT